MSAAPKPVEVRACFGRVNPGPTGPLSSDIGALVEGFRSRTLVPLAVDMVPGVVVGSVRIPRSNDVQEERRTSMGWKSTSFSC